MTPLTLGDRLKTLRYQHGLNQEQLMRLCGWQTVARISNYEMDKRSPSLAAIRMLSTQLNCTPEYLAFGITE